jgi:hypothetical protein
MAHMVLRKRAEVSIAGNIVHERGQSRKAMASACLASLVRNL